MLRAIFYDYETPEYILSVGAFGILYTIS
jgi:hypothetical protein